MAATRILPDSEKAGNNINERVLAMVWRYFQRDRTSVEARQGYLDRPVLLVLAVSLGLAVLVFVVLYALYLR